MSETRKSPTSRFARVQKSIGAARAQHDAMRYQYAVLFAVIRHMFTRGK